MSGMSGYDPILLLMRKILGVNEGISKNGAADVYARTERMISALTHMEAVVNTGGFYAAMQASPPSLLPGMIGGKIMADRKKKSHQLKVENATFMDRAFLEPGGGLSLWNDLETYNVYASSMTKGVIFAQLGMTAAFGAVLAALDLVIWAKGGALKEDEALNKQLAESKSTLYVAMATLLAGSGFKMLMNHLRMFQDIMTLESNDSWLLSPAGIRKFRTLNEEFFCVLLDPTKKELVRKRISAHLNYGTSLSAPWLFYCYASLGDKANALKYLNLVADPEDLGASVTSLHALLRMNLDEDVLHAFLEKTNMNVEAFTNDELFEQLVIRDTACNFIATRLAQSKEFPTLPNPHEKDIRKNVEEAFNDPHHPLHDACMEAAHNEAFAHANSPGKMIFDTILDTLGFSKLQYVEKRIAYYGFRDALKQFLADHDNDWTKLKQGGPIYTRIQQIVKDRQSEFNSIQQLDQDAFSSLLTQAADYRNTNKLRRS